MNWTLIHSDKIDALDRDWLEPALSDEYGIDDLVQDARNGLTAVYHAFCDGKRVGAMAVRIDRGHHGDDLVIVAAGGQTPNADGGLYAHLTQPCVDLARQLGCQRVRAHAQKSGVQTLLARAGWHECERVYCLGA